MRLLFFIFSYFWLLKYSFVISKCTIYSQRDVYVNLTCTRLTVLQENLDKARPNTTDINIFNSNISNIPGHSFVRFAAKLMSLDMHMCGIQTLDSAALIGLTKLEKLILWGNKLTWVSFDWFANLHNLIVLDLSFNSIQGFDLPFFQMVPYVQQFDIDYNRLRAIDFTMFSYMISLRRMKFGKNPWHWAYRTRLTWQLDNQNVDYADDWENWKWMSQTIKNCVESGLGDIPSDTILDCAVGKLLDYANEIFYNGDISNTSYNCNQNIQTLFTSMNSSQNNSSATGDRVARLILQDIMSILPSMENQKGFFSVLHN